MNAKRPRLPMPEDVRAELEREQAEIKARDGITVPLAELLRRRVLARPEPERTP